MQPLAFDSALDERGLWLGLQALLARLGGADVTPDDFLDALADVLGADRALLLLSYAAGETVPVHGRREGRALAAAELHELSRTLVREAEAAGRCVSMSAFDGGDGTESVQAFGILAAFAVPLEAGVLSAAQGEDGARRGVLYVDFRDRTRVPSPRVAEFLTTAAALLSSVVAQGQRLQQTRETLRSERVRLQRPAGPTLEQLLSSVGLEALARNIRAALVSDSPVLLTGESGTGKTMLAQLFAEASGRTPVVRATLGSSDDLNTITSELFGHEKGSFSGALARRVGVVEYADGGSLIFDEVLNLPRPAQQLLLDFTQFGTYRPLGWSRPEARRSKVRLICATNGDMEAAVADGRFRADLYYRIAGHRLHLPSLRERRAEIPGLARAWLLRVDPARGWTLDAALAKWLASETLDWPGNFRQLESTLRRAMDHALVEDVDADRLTPAHVDAPPATTRPAPPPETPAAPPPGWLELQQRRDSLDNQEREVIRAALARADGVVSRAARELGLPAHQPAQPHGVVRTGPRMTAGWPEALSRRFTPGAPLGQGNFGTVFEATERGRGARVAVKVLRADRPSALQAFKREFRALTDLAHENLVALHELGREGERWFLVMEVVDGVELLPALKGAELPRIRNVFAQVALGLGFLHASGRLHRDLKPPNVRVTPAGRAVVLDFGLALDGPPEDTEGLVGSAAYLSPEQAAGADASPASDVYALGVMLHEALCGRRPFEGSALEVLAAKRNGEAVVQLEPGPLRALCTAMLARTPSARPSAAEVVTALDPALVPLLAQRPEAPLIGREDALGALEQAFGGEGAIALWLQGAPGLGKSALLRQFLTTRRQAEGALVLASRCFEHESTPFKAIDGLVDGLGRWLSGQAEGSLPEPLRPHGANLARSFPALRQLRWLADAPASASPPEAHLHESAVALRELLTFAASGGRVVVAIDDLHWADTDSVPFLREMLDSDAPPPVLFVGALREEGHPLLEPLRRPRGPFGTSAQRLEVRLAPLTPTQSHHLARALLPEGDAAEALVAEAGGNPFLLQALAGHGGGLREAVAARVTRLPASAQRLLEAVCLAGAPLPRPLWASAAALEGDDALALGHLRAGRLVRVRRDGALEPYHDTLRRAVEEQLLPATRAQHHGRLADALEATGDPELLARHLHGAGRVDAAAHQAIRGAERALQALAFHHAAELYAKALDWAPRREGARALRAARGEALSLAGRGADAAEALLSAREGATAAERLALEQRAAAQLLRAGHTDSGLELTRTVLEAQGLSLTRTPRGAVASLAWTRARLRWRGSRFQARPEADIEPAELARIDALTSTSIGLAAVDSLRAADLMGQALLRALDAGEPGRVAVCLGFETAFSGNAGGVSELRTRELLNQADRLSRSLGQPYARACALGGAGIAYFHLGHLAQAQAHCEEASELFARCPGAVKELFTNQLFALAALAQAGELGELGRRIGGYLQLATERGDRYAEANLRSGLPNLAWLAADDVARARAEADAALPGLQTSGYSVQHFFMLLCRFQLELYAGDGAAAQRVLDAGLPPLERSLLSRTEWVAIAMAWMRGRVLLATGEAGRSSSARKAVRDAAVTLERRRRPWADALALSLRAGEQRAVGADVTALLEQVVTRCEGAGLKLHAQCARFALATLKDDAPAQARANEAAAALGVKSLARMTRVYLPGVA